MKEITIPSNRENGYYSIMEVEDFEYVNPVDKIQEVTINLSMSMDRNYLSFAKKGDMQFADRVANPEQIIEKVLKRRALEMWQSEYNKIMAENLSNSLFDILESTSKKEQIKNLKGLSLTGTQLISFIFKAYLNYGFRYSAYSSTHYHAGFDEKEMPMFAYKEQDDNVISIGKTNLTSGQMKQAITDRKVTIAKFLDRGEIWHCFFLTFKSIRGKERGWQGKPHIHYISNNWGLSRETALAQLKSKNYNLPSPLPHINWNSSINNF